MKLRKNIWKSKKLYNRSLKKKKKLSTYFGESKYAKENRIKYYREYLETPHWKKISAEYKEKFPICEVCRKNNSSQVHHKSYQRLGHERYWDLIAICRDCHRAKHNLA